MWLTSPVWSLECSDNQSQIEPRSARMKVNFTWHRTTQRCTPQWQKPGWNVTTEKGRWAQHITVDHILHTLALLLLIEHSAVSVFKVQHTYVYTLHAHKIHVCERYYHHWIFLMHFTTQRKKLKRDREDRPRQWHPNNNRKWIGNEIKSVYITIAILPGSENT